jgi:hypothetical protein
MMRSRDGRWQVTVVRLGLGGDKGPGTPYYRVTLDGKFYRNARTAAELEALGIVLAELEVLPEPALDPEAEDLYRQEKRDPELVRAHKLLIEGQARAKPRGRARTRAATSTNRLRRSRPCQEALLGFFKLTCSEKYS